MPRTAVFSDIDGTLLNSAHQVTPRTRDAIRAVQAAGVPFVIVTARGVSGTYPLLEQQDISCTVVTYSGGVIMDEGRNVIHHHGLTRAQAQEVVDFAEAEGLDMTWSAYSFEDWVAPDRADPRLLQEERIVMAEAREGTIASIERDEVQKILCLCTPGSTKEVERRLKGRFPEFAIAISSETLEATAVDSRNDVIATAAVLASAVVSQLIGIDLDGWAGLAVGGFILWSGIQLVREAVSPLLGKPTSSTSATRS